MNKLLIANWKANPTTLDEAKILFEAEAKTATEHENVNVVLCPPFVYLDTLSLMMENNDWDMDIGAQDSFWESSGAYTGQVTYTMLDELNVAYVLVGHSEHRALGETDEMINKKIKALVEPTNEITPVLLVGEQEKNEAIAQDVLVDQISRAVQDVPKELVNSIRFVYEPSWAISTQSGNIAVMPDDVLTAIAFMRSVVAKLAGLSENDLQPFLYGGSINPSNAHDLFQHPEIGGGVIGGASLKPDQFAEIIKITSGI